MLAAYDLGQMGPEARSAIPALTAALDSPNPDVRFVIAKALGKIGSEAAVPHLAQALQDKDENVRMAAAIALDHLAPEAQAALSALQKSLRDGNWFVRSHAANAFVRLAARDKAMLPVLLRAVLNPLQESDSTTVLEEDFKGRREKEIPAVIAIDALAAIGLEAVPPLLESLKNLDFDESDSRSLNNLSFAIIKIASQGGDEQLVDLLLALLLNVPASQKAFVLHLLSQTGVKLAFGKKPDLEQLTVEDMQRVVDSLSHKKWQIRAATVAAVPGLVVPPQHIFYLGEALGDQDWQVRSIAAAALGNIPETELGEVPPDFIPFLLAPALQDEVWQVRLSAIGALNRPGKTIPRLLELLESTNQEISLAAAMKVLEFGVASDRAETVLLNALQHHQDLITRHAALEALTKGNLNTAASAVMLALEDDNPKVRYQAAYSLRRQLSSDSDFMQTETGQKLLQALIKGLQDENRNVRTQVIWTLGSSRPPAAAGPLAAALAAADQYERRRIFQSLFAIEANPSEIIHNLRHADYQIRLRAVEQLDAVEEVFDNLTNPLMQALLRSLKDPNPDVRAAVAAILMNHSVGRHEERPEIYNATIKVLKQDLPKLLACLKSEDPRTRSDAIYVLGRLGPAARSTAPTLRDLLADPNWLIRYGAAVSLARINPKDTSIIPVLAEVFRDHSRVELLGLDAEIPHEELYALSVIGSPASISLLLDLMRLRDPQFRYTHYLDDRDSQAAYNLMKTGPKAIPFLVNALKNDQGRFLAAQTLGQMGPLAMPPLRSILQKPEGDENVLTEILRDKDADYRRSAVYALGEVGSKNQIFKNIIVNLLYAVMQDQSEPAGVRWQAAASLMKMGENVDFFFASQNLPNPAAEHCPYENGVDVCHFDLYAARILYRHAGHGGGGQELFLLVRDMLEKKSSPGSAIPKPQPAATGR